MDQATLELEIKKTLVEQLFLDITPEAIASDQSLYTHYGLDSMTVLQFVVGLEERFGLSFEAMGKNDFRPATFGTVQQIAAIVRECLDKK